MIGRIYAGVFGLVGWLTIVGQYFVSHDASLSSTIDFFSYFTILSNILVAATLTSAAIAPKTAIGRYLLRPSVAVATAVYITVTGLTYYFVLSSLYSLEGWERTLDHMLHYVLPPAYVAFWLFFVPKGELRYSAAMWALVPPLVYAAYTFIHGPWTGFYPYPFVDVPTIGVARAAQNVIEFVAFFFATGVVYITFDRVIARMRRAD